MLNLTNIKLEFTTIEALQLKNGIETMIEQYCLADESVILDAAGKDGLYHINKLSKDLTRAMLGDEI